MEKENVSTVFFEDGEITKITGSSDEIIREYIADFDKQPKKINPLFKILGVLDRAIKKFKHMDTILRCKSLPVGLAQDNFDRGMRDLEKALGIIQNLRKKKKVMYGRIQKRCRSCR